MTTRRLIAEEKYARLLDSSGNAITSQNGALNTNVVINEVDVSGTVIIRGTTITSTGRLPVDVSGIVNVSNLITDVSISNTLALTDVGTSNSRLLTDVSGMVKTIVSTSTTTVWNDDVVFGDTSVSATHDGRYHGKYNIFGAISNSCTLIIEFSDTSATWYPTHHVMMIGTDGIVDGTFDDIVVPYIRLRKQGTGDVSGTVLICGKGV